MANKVESHTVRRTLSLTIAVIGAVMVLAGVFAYAVKNGTLANPALLSGLSLVIIGTAIFLRRPASKRG